MSSLNFLEGCIISLWDIDIFVWVLIQGNIFVLFNYVSMLKQLIFKNQSGSPLYTIKTLTFVAFKDVFFEKLFQNLISKNHQIVEGYFFSKMNEHV